MKKLFLVLVLLSSLAYGKWDTSSMQGTVSFSIGNNKGNFIIECSRNLADAYISFNANNTELEVKDIINPNKNIKDNGYFVNSDSSTILDNKKRNQFLNEFVNMKSFIVVTNKGNFEIKNDGSKDDKDFLLSVCKYVKLPNMVSYDDAQKLLKGNMLDESYMTEEFYDLNLRTLGNPYAVGYIEPTDTMVVCNRWGMIDIFPNGSLSEDENFRNEELPCNQFKVNKIDVENGNFKFFEETNAINSK